MQAAAAKRLPVWLPPVAGLCATAGAIAAALALATGGREVGDDAPHLLELTRNPWILLGPPSAALPATWRSFPPFLPPLFGLLVRPFDALASDFAAIRLGALAWGVLLVTATARLGGAIGLSRDESRRALWLLALSPSLLAASALLPQEEAYVALFALALVAAAAADRPWLVAVLLAAAMLAGKLFLAALVLPLACHARDPLREVVRYGAAVAAAAGGWIAFQAWRDGSAPILGYAIDPATSVTVWAALSGTAVALDPAAVRLLSGAATVLGIAAVSGWARLRGLPLLHTAALGLLVPVLTLSIAMPPYLLWSLPLAALALAAAPARVRLAGFALAVAWGGVAYAAKLMSGVALAVETSRPGGKTAIAELVVAVLGPDAPFRGLRHGLVAGLALLGASLAIAIARAGLPQGQAPREVREVT
jgi:hypothetical protein